MVLMVLLRYSICTEELFWTRPESDDNYYMQQQPYVGNPVAVVRDTQSLFVNDYSTFRVSYSCHVVT